MAYYISLSNPESMEFGPLLGPFFFLAFQNDSEIAAAWVDNNGQRLRPQLLCIAAGDRFVLNNVVVKRLPPALVQRQPGLSRYPHDYGTRNWRHIGITADVPSPPLQVSAAPTPTGVLMPDPRGLAQDLIRLARKLGYQYEHGDWAPLSQITANEAGYGKIDAELTKLEAARFDDYVITEAFGKWLKANRAELYDVLAGAHGGRITSADAYIRQEGQDWLLVWSGPWRRAPVPIKYCYWHNQDHFDNAIGMVLKSHPDKLTA